MEGGLIIKGTQYSNPSINNSSSPSISRMRRFHRLQADKDNIIEKRNQGDNYRLCSWQHVRGKDPATETAEPFRFPISYGDDLRSESRQMEEMRGRIGEEKRKIPTSDSAPASRTIARFRLSSLSVGNGWKRFLPGSTVGLQVDWASEASQPVITPTLHSKKKHWISLSLCLCLSLSLCVCVWFELYKQVIKWKSEMKKMQCSIQVLP